MAGAPLCVCGHSIDEHCPTGCVAVTPRTAGVLDIGIYHCEVFRRKPPRGRDKWPKQASDPRVLLSPPGDRSARQRAKMPKDH